MTQFMDETQVSSCRPKSTNTHQYTIHWMPLVTQFMDETQVSSCCPKWTNTHQCTIHWMPLMTQLWMKLNQNRLELLTSYECGCSFTQGSRGGGGMGKSIPWSPFISHSQVQIIDFFSRYPLHLVIYLCWKSMPLSKEYGIRSEVIGNNTRDTWKFEKYHEEHSAKTYDIKLRGTHARDTWELWK
jgi:hypothetical protein